MFLFSSFFPISRPPPLSPRPPPSHPHPRAVLIWNFLRIRKTRFRKSALEGEPISPRRRREYSLVKRRGTAKVRSCLLPQRPLRPPFIPRRVGGGRHRRGRVLVDAAPLSRRLPPPPRRACRRGRRRRPPSRADEAPQPPPLSPRSLNLQRVQQQQARSIRTARRRPLARGDGRRRPLSCLQRLPLRPPSPMRCAVSPMIACRSDKVLLVAQRGPRNPCRSGCRRGTRPPASAAGGRRRLGLDETRPPKLLVGSVKREARRHWRAYVAEARLHSCHRFPFHSQSL